MSDAKKPLDQVMDLFVYAPLGLLLNADEVIPNLIERGRQQVTMARMFGQMAVQQGQTEASKAAAKLQEQATEVLEQLAARTNGPSSPARPSSPSRPSSQRTPDPSHAAAASPRPVASPDPEPAAAPVPARAKAKSAKPAGALAIPDYDSLSASQVVPRLEGLSARELDAVRVYEAANRGRKTILSKITALQG